MTDYFIWASGIMLACMTGIAVYWYMRASSLRDALEYVMSEEVENELIDEDFRKIVGQWEDDS